MLFEDTYITISDPSEGVYRASGSKFLAYAFPVNTEAEIKPLVNRLKLLHPSANHHCWAARIASDQSAQRFADDGEPAGTAGRPILNIILSKQLNNIVIVVVRYFGGTLLGIPGLISAYKAAAAEALTNSKFIEKTLNDVYRVEFDYLHMNDVMKVVKDHNLPVSAQHFDTSCMLEIGIRKTNVEAIAQKFYQINSAQLTYLGSN